MFHVAAWFAHVPAPAGERSNWTVATPEPESAESLERATVPRRSALAPGLVTEPVGSVLSTRTVIAADVKALPAASVVTTRTS